MNDAIWRSPVQWPDQEMFVLVQDFQCTVGSVPFWGDWSCLRGLFPSEMGSNYNVI